MNDCARVATAMPMRVRARDGGAGDGGAGDDVSANDWCDDVGGARAGNVAMMRCAMRACGWRWCRAMTGGCARCVNVAGEVSFRS